MANNHSSLPIPYTGPPQTSDPYPEHPDRLGGVRQHTQPPPLQIRELHTHRIARPPSPFAAIPRTPTQTVRSRPLPLASIGLYVGGQLILALAIAVGSVGPVVGIVVCLVWMLCGLVLVLAQQRTAHEPGATVGSGSQSWDGQPGRNDDGGPCNVHRDRWVSTPHELPGIGSVSEDRSAAEARSGSDQRPWACSYAIPANTKGLAK